MRTSLNEIKQIEAYLSKQLTASDRLVFEARMLINKKLRHDVTLQRMVYSIIKYHFRATLRPKFQHLHQQLFDDPAHASLKQEIIQLFKP
jgi:hypothetical protein